MTKKIAGCGCFAFLGGIAVVSAMLHAMGLSQYVVAYGQFLLGLASSPDALPANWVAADARVVHIVYRTDQNYRRLATVVLRYADASGREQVGTFEVFSPSRRLGGIKSDDRPTIKVCRDNPTILKSDQFVVSEQNRCSP